MLGVGNESPFPPPSGDGSHPPGRSTSFRWGDRTSVVATPDKNEP